MNKETKTKMGRPKIANPSDKQLPRIRITEDQLNTYKQASQHEQQTLSAWVREALDEKASRTKNKT